MKEQSIKSYYIDDDDDDVVVHWLGDLRGGPMESCACLSPLHTVEHSTSQGPLCAPATVSTGTASPNGHEGAMAMAALTLIKANCQPQPCCLRVGRGANLVQHKEIAGLRLALLTEWGYREGN